MVLLIGGLATAGLAIWHARWTTRSHLWKTINTIEGWIYGVGGVLIALLGAAILIDHIGLGRVT